MKKRKFWWELLMVTIGATVVLIGLLAITAPPATGASTWKSQNEKGFTTVNPNRYMFRQDGRERRRHSKPCGN